MKWNKNTQQAFLWLFASLFIACGSAENEQEKGRTMKQMVHEGMAAETLRSILGEPDSTALGGTVYDVELGVKKKVERWYYSKRTVLLIDDIVKVPNERPAIN